MKLLIKNFMLFMLLIFFSINLYAQDVPYVPTPYVVVEGICRGNFSVSNSNPSYCDVYRIKDGLIEEITTYIVDVSSNEEKN